MSSQQLQFILSYNSEYLDPIPILYIPLFGQSHLGMITVLKKPFELQIIKKNIESKDWYLNIYFNEIKNDQKNFLLLSLVNGCIIDESRIFDETGLKNTIKQSHSLAES